MSLAELPTRRSEAWRYSDLRSVLDGVAAPMAGEGAVIERLAAAAGTLVRREVAPGASELVVDRLTADVFAPSAEIFHVAAGGSLKRVALQIGAGVVLSHFRVVLEAGASFHQFVLGEGGKLARLETAVEVVGNDAVVELNGLYLAGAGRHVDITSFLDHKARGGETRQLVKGVARRGGRGIFQGQIVVAREGQLTDARQYHHGLLLEEGAEIFAKPELLIYADDVQCAHGNTAGSLDEQALFYLRSRGVPEAKARALLIEAFISETIPYWVGDALRDEVDARVTAWLGGLP